MSSNGEIGNHWGDRDRWIEEVLLPDADSPM